MTITVPFSVDKELEGRWERYLARVQFPFTKKRSRGELMYTISIKEPMDAYWLGCNMVALQNRLFDGPLTTTLSS